MTDITTARVLDYLKRHPAASMAEIGAELGIKARSNVLYHLRKLELAGKLEHVPGQHRSYRIVEVTK